jgi:pullulanase
MTAEQATKLPVELSTPLGAEWHPDHTTFRLWAPTAASAALRLYRTGTDAEPGAQACGAYAMQPAENGVWQAELAGQWNGVYYQYVLTFGDGASRAAIVLADPYARACGANGARSMVIDLDGAVPEGWEQDRAPAFCRHACAVWEVHVGDFSADVHSGVPEAWRGKYLAFTLPDTTLDGKGQFPTCAAHLRRLGVTHVQLQPIFDFGTVDETKPGGYNWGYDPVNYNVPEGSYATDAFHGAVRVRECRAMIAGLHRAGLRVVMDVVYNHTWHPDSWLERSVPGYYNRRTPAGALTNGSGCGNDLASERTMMRRYLVDSTLYWATEYHIDGFRFDLMALEDVETMNAIRAALDALPGGQDILMYGEPWAGGATCMDPGARAADKSALDALSPRIGFFCDDTRDTIKGSTFDAAQPGYVNGGPYLGVKMLHALDAWRDGADGFVPRAAGQVVQYVSAHDNFTLWDKLKCTARDTVDFAAENSTVLAQNRMAAGIYLTCRGLPFWQAGEEFARTKQGDPNTYRGPQTRNALDWTRAAAHEDMIRYYAGLLAIRRTFPELSGAGQEPAPVLLAMPDWIVGFVLEHSDGTGGELAVFYNPESDAQSVALPGGSWRLLCDGTVAQPEPFGTPFCGQISLAPYSVTILRAELT